MKTLLTALTLIPMLAPLTPAHASNSVVQLKFSIVPSTIDTALKAFELDRDDAKPGAVFFFDTPDLMLFRQGVILRARHQERKKGDDTTVKFRPLDSDRVEDGWFAMDGFKCEDDRSGATTVSACSYSITPDSGRIDQVAAGMAPIDDLFTKKQADFLAEFATDWDGDWQKLDVYGPIEMLRWKAKLKSLDDDLDIELWTIAPRVQALEISTRADATVALAVENKLKRLFEKRGIELAREQEMKTRVALEYLSRHPKSSDRRP